MAMGGLTVDGFVNGFNDKITISVVITCFVAVSSGLIFGYDIGISGSIFTNCGLRAGGYDGSSAADWRGLQCISAGADANEAKYGCEFHNHICAISNIFYDALPLQIWGFPVLCGLDAVMTFFIAFFLPETRGIPLEPMCGLWEPQSYCGRFVKN
ncbi:hypothetical protein FEM48_Zijuj06G0115100 [Ziziphus jujuba var. spinosa]|uniref:Major facilitator superfamily (MFS) profile domain-containing protein n=1 Tax=Ziziphus jujuba var. spinosa TaxID=714518 RepID=A0A978V914_ZIZJJ|nr:hypothetical protein FEM48_Zijuj06G0115100 [Ziziphus jujuba var. spinosa]